MKHARTASPPKDRAFAIASLATLCALAWGYLLYMGWGMAHMDAGAAMAIMPRMTSWHVVDLGLVFAMWSIMMIAMMLPSAAPMMMLFAALGQRMQQPRPHTEWAAFLGGYIAVWSAFSLLMTLAQWGLLEARLVSPMMEASSKSISGMLLLVAGSFQFASFKQTCLAKCRSPLSFLIAEWRKGLRGAWIMGMRHGLFCLGCCWLVMLLLFVLGIMNVLWIAALAAFVLLEKTLPNTRWFSRAGGLAFIGWGIALLVASGNG